MASIKKSTRLFHLTVSLIEAEKATAHEKVTTLANSRLRFGSWFPFFHHNRLNIECMCLIASCTAFSICPTLAASIVPFLTRRALDGVHHISIIRNFYEASVTFAIFAVQECRFLAKSARIKLDACVLFDLGTLSAARHKVATRMAAVPSMHEFFWVLTYTVTCLFFQNHTEPITRVANAFTIFTDLQEIFVAARALLR